MPPTKPKATAPEDPTPPTAAQQQLDAEALAAKLASEDIADAAAKRAKAAAGPKTNPRAGMVDALLVERRGYVQRGLGDRVAEVDAQIAFYGGEIPED